METTLEEDRKLIKSSIILALMILFLPWMTFILELSFQDKFTSLGILPKQGKGLLGILTSWLVHGDLQHLMSNSFPFFIGLCLLFYHYRKIAFEVFIYLLIVTGIWVWLLARPNYHIGASGLVYALSSFLIFSGVLRKNRRLMAASLIIIFVHSGLLYGLLPINEKISHEAHISGFFAGIIFAYWYAQKAIKEKKKTYQQIGKIQLSDYWQNTDTTFEHGDKIDYQYIEKKD